MNPLSAVLGIADKVLTRVIPDKNQRAQAKEELLKAAQDSDVELALAQISVNKEEAQHKSLFVAGARPAAGWVCTFCLLIVVVAAVVGIYIDIEVASLIHVYSTSVLPIHATLIGAKSYDKLKGTATQSLSPRKK